MQTDLETDGGTDMTQEEYRQSCMDVVYLAACAINGETPDAERIAGMDLDNLFQAAEQHLLTGITAMAIESAGVQNETFRQAKGKAIRKVVLFDAERAAVLSALEEAGIWYMPLKGAVIKDLYPKIGMRQMADNDILYDVSRSDDVRTIMERLGFKTVSFVNDAYHHDHYYKSPVCNFEMHRALFTSDTDDVLFHYNQQIRGKMIRNQDSHYRYHLSSEDFYVYMIAHEYKHFSSGGTGLRSLLDTYVYLIRENDMLDWTYITEELNKLGIWEFELQNRSLAFHLFTNQELTEEDQEVLDYIFSSGTYGTPKHAIENVVAKRGKFGYLFIRAFLPYRTMCSLYPILNKVPILLPVCWVLRWIRALIYNRNTVAYQWKTALGTESK